MATRDSKAPTISTIDLGCRLAAVESKIEQSVLVLGFLDEYLEGDDVAIVKDSIELAVELARQAQHKLKDLSEETGAARALNASGFPT